MTDEEMTPTKFCTGCGLEQPEKNDECAYCGLTGFSADDPNAPVEEDAPAEAEAVEEPDEDLTEEAPAADPPVGFDDGTANVPDEPPPDNEEG